MRDASGRHGSGIAAAALGVFVISAAIIALELALMRCLSIARWHHFSYLVISTALLGFGASGTLLTFCLLYTSPSPRDRTRSRMPSSA